MFSLYVFVFYFISIFFKDFKMSLFVDLFLFVLLYCVFVLKDEVLELYY